VAAVTGFGTPGVFRGRRAVRPSPVFLAVLAVTALGAGLAWTQQLAGSRLGDVGVFLFVLGGWVVSVSLHEFAHAYAAFRAGDRSVEAAGYLSLNPLRYAHPLLSIVLPLLFIVQGGIGLPGGAVYLHRQSFRSKAAQSLAAAGGPLVNVVLAGVLLVIARSHNATVLGHYALGAAAAEHGRFWTGLAFLGFLQLTAAVLNLLPIPGLDGWAILEPYLSRETVGFGDKIKPWGMLGVILLLQAQRINSVFFTAVDWLYDRSGAARTLADLGHEFFRFWAKAPW
jgi:Zn-dependent protease